MVLLLETDRLLLREFEAGDRSRIVLLCGDFEVSSMCALVPHPYTDGCAEYFLNTVCTAKDNITLAIVRRKDNLLVGAISLDSIQANDTKTVPSSATIGYWLGKEFWGNGLMTEAASAIVAHAFDDLKLDVLHGTCWEENPKSARVMTKVGFQLLDTLPRGAKNYMPCLARGKTPLLRIFYRLTQSRFTSVRSKKVLLEFELLLCRHGESEGNKRRICSTPDQRLTEKGQLQASQLGEYLKTNYRSIDRVWCSDLARVKQTAEIVHKILLNAQLDINPQLSIDPLLREKDPGEFAGKPLKSIKRARQEDGNERAYRPGDGGESWDDVKSRAKQFMENIVSEIASESGSCTAPLVITSGGFIKEFLNGEIYQNSSNPAQNRSKNCSVCTFAVVVRDVTPRLDYEVRLVSLNIDSAAPSESGRSGCKRVKVGGTADDIKKDVVNVSGSELKTLLKTPPSSQPTQYQEEYSDCHRGLNSPSHSL